MRSLNLIYSSSSNLRGAADARNTGFFSKVGKIREKVLKFKREDVINDFNQKDHEEVERGATYAVFPELKKRFYEQQEKITLDSIREGLKARGVTNEILQTKALALLLQSKAGVQFALSNVLYSLLLDNDHKFAMNQRCNVEFEVKSKNRVRLILTATWDDITTSPQEPSFNGRVEVDITPSKVVINSFKITQISKSDEANLAFAFLQSNQAFIWQKFVILLKSFFGINSDLEIENAATDSFSWEKNTKKHEIAATTDADSGLGVGAENSDAELHTDVVRDHGP